MVLGLPSKYMARATLIHVSADGERTEERLSASQAVILIWFDTIFAFHVKLHACVFTAIDFEHT